MKTIAVIGSGYVGVTTAAIAATAGYKVHLIDTNEHRIKVLKSGKSFFYEEGINPLIKNAIDNGSLSPSTSYKGVKESSIVFSCVGTPDKSDGGSNLDYVFAAAETAAKLMSADTIYVQKSTVPVGTGGRVRQIIPSPKNYISNPEFLREGSAIQDTLFFDRIVVGGNNRHATEKVTSFYKDIESQREVIAGKVSIESVSSAGEYFKTNLESAELTKVTANAFLALKISFANSIAKLADRTGADITQVMDAVGSDKRIGRSFLNAGRGYGGGCFPKDVSGLIGTALEHGVDMPIMTAATKVNSEMPAYIVEKIHRKVGDISNKKITVLGLAFKAGTSDARRSPSIKIANLLNEMGCSVKAYDPHANKEASESLNEAVRLCSNMEVACKDSDVIVVATDWSEFIEYDWSSLAASNKNRLMVDCMNSLESKKITDSGFVYIGVGKNI